MARIPHGVATIVFQCILCFVSVHGLRHQVEVFPTIFLIRYEVVDIYLINNSKPVYSLAMWPFVFLILASIWYLDLSRHCNLVLSKERNQNHSVGDVMRVVVWESNERNQNHSVGDVMRVVVWESNERNQNHSVVDVMRVVMWESNERNQNLSVGDVMRVVVCESNERNQNFSVGDVMRVVVWEINGSKDGNRNLPVLNQEKLGLERNQFNF